MIEYDDDGRVGEREQHIVAGSADEMRAALELIATSFPGEEFDGWVEQVERAEQMAREALGWHWHVEFRDWRNSDGGLRLDMAVSAYDDALEYYWDKDDARRRAEIIARYNEGAAPVHKPGMDTSAVVTDCHLVNCAYFAAMEKRLANRTAVMVAQDTAEAEQRKKDREEREEWERHGNKRVSGWRPT